MSVYPFLRLSRTVLFTDCLYSVNCQRFTSTCSQRWSNNYPATSTSRYKCIDTVGDYCLTSSMVNQMSSPVFDLIVGLTTARLSSFYLKWYQFIGSLNKSWISSVNFFSSDDKKEGTGDGNPFGDNPFGDQFDKLSKDLPPLLMDWVDPITTPGPITSIKNLFNLFFIIKPSYDSSFSYQQFLDGARQAVCVISDNLSRGETAQLEDLVESEALAAIEENLVKFTPAQLADLKIDETDIIFYLAKEISPIERDNRKFIEITVICNVIKGYQEKMEAAREKKSFFMPDPDMTFCNYRFIREYTKGVENGDWTCNRLNHFKWGHFIQSNPFYRK